jgi:hypothetical protein
MDAGALDVLANDPTSHHVLCDDMCDALNIHPIIQSRRAARAGERGEPGSQHWHRLAGEDLSHQHIGALRTAPEATLPHQLGVLLRTLRRQRGAEHVVKRGRSVTVPAFWTAADDDLEAALHAP